MTEDEIWDAKWLAFKLTIKDRTWIHGLDCPSPGSSYLGEQLIELLESKDDANYEGRPPRAREDEFVGGMHPDSAMAHAFKFAGIALSDSDKLQLAARRALRRSK